MASFVAAQFAFLVLTVDEQVQGSLAGSGIGSQGPKASLTWLSIGKASQNNSQSKTNSVLLNALLLWLECVAAAYSCNRIGVWRGPKEFNPTKLKTPIDMNWHLLVISNFLHPCHVPLRLTRCKVLGNIKTIPVIIGWESRKKQAQPHTSIIIIQTEEPLDWEMRSATGIY